LQRARVPVHQVAHHVGIVVNAEVLFDGQEFGQLAAAKRDVDLYLCLLAHG
jgi:hypothetical protein